MYRVEDNQTIPIPESKSRIPALRYDRHRHEGHPASWRLGTRLRPLTLHTPKPIVPIFNRPFLYYQIDLLRQISEIDEVILSLNYQRQRIEAIVGDGAPLGVKVRYLVEPKPLGTAGAVKLRRQVSGRFRHRL